MMEILREDALPFEGLSTDRTRRWSVGSANGCTAAKLVVSDAPGYGLDLQAMGSAVE